MRRLLLTSFSSLLLFVPFALLAQSGKPVIDRSLRNGASMRPLPEGQLVRRSGFGLAPGSIFVGFGSNLGPAKLVHADAPYPVQLPSDSGGTQVSFQSISSGATYQAYLIHSSATQVSGIIPSDLPLGFAQVRVSYQGVESDPKLIEIVEADAGLFTFSQNGQGPAVIQNYESPTSQPLNSLSRPAAPGQYLILWGTGLGAIDGPDNAPPIGNLRSDVSVRFGNSRSGVVVPAEYAGRAPGFPGVDQINVRIPLEGVELSCYSKIQLMVGNSSSGALDVAISDKPGECNHPWGLSAQRQAALDQGETATFIHLNVANPGLSARVANADPIGIALNVGPTGQVAAESGCSQSSFLTTPVTAPTGPPAAVPLPPGLTAADPGRLRLIGPDFRAAELERTAHDAVAFLPKTALPADFLIPGAWTIRSNGGNDVGPFETTFRVAPFPPFDLPDTLSTDTDIELSWDPTIYEPGEFIHIFLREADLSQNSGRSVHCTVAGSAGELQIHSADLESLEAEIGSDLRWQVIFLSPPLYFTGPGLEHGQVLFPRSFSHDTTLVE